MLETKRRLPWVTKFLKMNADQVHDKFMNLPGAYTDGEKNERFTYIEGTRSDRVLIVAHADTVWGNLAIKVDYHNE